MTDYELIKRSCLKRGELWEDPEFPATQASVFYHQTPPFQFVWKRPKLRLYLHEKFHQCVRLEKESAFSENKILIHFEKSYVTGQCLCTTCLPNSTSFQEKWGLFYRVVPADQTFGSPDQYAGVFRFRLWWCGGWVEVLVDDRLPTVHGRLAFLQAQNSDQFWPGLFEKAYAKLHGSYEALKYGTLLDGLSDLTGGITESISIRQDPTTCGRMLSKLLEMTSITTCTVQSTATQLRNQVEKLANGIHIGTNYRLW
ncbi:calpain-C-like, partial [Gryllus bimaculatus]